LELLGRYDTNPTFQTILLTQSRYLSLNWLIHRRGQLPLRFRIRNIPWVSTCGSEDTIYVNIRQEALSQHGLHLVICPCGTSWGYLTMFRIISPCFNVVLENSLYLPGPAIFAPGIGYVNVFFIAALTLTVDLHCSSVPR
jgi:hypothetical protein